ncbi:MAG TPA: tetratricopeptide repeat protein, partial [Nitrosopumilaceae archaeon]|nr:tetratricopeptide repeat protein [Nitrosopumilaceae archaeon]
MGLVYDNQGNYPRALEYSLKALKLAEELNNKIEISKNLGNIGLLYANLSNRQKALDYYLKALKIKEEIGNRDGVAITLGNIGVIYHEQHEYTKALDYYFQSLRIKEEIGNKAGITSTLGDIGEVFNSQGDYEKALDYYMKALKIAKEIGDKSNTALWLDHIGNLYLTLKKYKDAYTYIYSALAISDSIGTLHTIKNQYLYLSELYEKANIPLPDSVGGKILSMEQMRLRSKYYFMRYIATRDSLFGEENKKQLVRNEMNYEFDKKEALIKKEHEKQIAISETEKKKQQIVIWSVIGGLLMSFILAGFIFRSLRVTKKQKYIIELQKDEVSRQKHIVEEQK